MAKINFKHTNIADAKVKDLKDVLNVDPTIKKLKKEDV